MNIPTKATARTPDDQLADPKYPSNQVKDTSTDVADHGKIQLGGAFRLPVTKAR